MVVPRATFPYRMELLHLRFPPGATAFRKPGAIGSERHEERQPTESRTYDSRSFCRTSPHQFAFSRGESSNDSGVPAAPRAGRLLSRIWLLERGPHSLERAGRGAQTGAGRAAGCVTRRTRTLLRIQLERVSRSQACAVPGTRRPAHRARLSRSALAPGSHRPGGATVRRLRSLLARPAVLQTRTSPRSCCLAPGLLLLDPHSSACPPDLLDWSG